ncbi:type II secretion system protein [Massilia sp. RP-1-19]|uniref:Type II secretion system protein n=1 Tax=Massilia polaris TaxID=2728846 RepID=A0A848HIG7_9BURK|nr:type II secretion system protein [Massilia polaris]NML60847.1 type II secretion system protein [Massilia polaris]
MTVRAIHQARQAGFTLIEAVMVIVIIGVLGAVVAVFIRMPVQGYHDSVARAELTDIADLSLRRMARELRLALPNSIVISDGGNAISFFMTKAGGRYLTPDDDLAGQPVLDFVDPGKRTFTMIGHAPDANHAIMKGDYVVVYNLGIDPADAYVGGNRATVEKFTTVDAAKGLYQIELQANPFAQQNPPMPSPGSRFHVVGQPVSYFCTPGAGGSGTMSRQWNYGIVKGKPTGAFVPTNLLAQRVTGCKFDYSTDANSRGALVILTLVLESPGDGGSIKLVHQVHVDNTP